MRKGIKILGKVVATLVLCVIFFPVLLAALLQIDSLQTSLVERAATFASEKLGTRVEIDRLSIHFFNRVVIEGFYVEDFDQDTLLYAARAEVGIAGLSASNGVRFSKARLSGAKFHLRESSRGVMNVKEVVERLKNPNRKRREHPFELHFGSLEFDTLEFWLKRNVERKRDSGIDWADMKLRNMRGELSNFSIVGPAISGVIEGLSAEEQTGFVLQELGGELLVGQGLVALSDVKIRTSESDINMPEFEIRADDWTLYKEFIDRVMMKASFANSKVSTNDIAHFAPSLGGWNLTAEDIDIKMEGTVREMAVKLWGMKTSGGTSLRADLTMRGLPDVKSTDFDIKIHQLKSNIYDARKMAHAILKKELSSSLVQMLARLGSLSATGRFTGRLSDFNVSSLLSTELGTLDAEASLRGEAGEKSLAANLSTRNFRVGSLLKQKRLGRVTFALTAAGPIGGEKTALGAVGAISSLEFDSVEYSSLWVDARVGNKYYDVKVESDEPKLRMKLDADIDLRDQIPLFVVDLNLKDADLNAMRINRRDSVSHLSLNLKGKVRGSDPNSMQGDINIMRAEYRHRDTMLVAKDISISALRQEQRRNLKLRSQYADLDFSSNRGYLDAMRHVVDILRSYIPDMYNSQSGVLHTEADTTLRGEHTLLRLNVKNINDLTEAVSRGLELAPGTIVELDYKPSERFVEAALKSKYVQRGNLLATNIDLNLRSVVDSLRLKLLSDGLYVGSLRFTSVGVSGGAAKNRFALDADIKDTISHLAANFDWRGSVRRLDDGHRRLTLKLLPSLFSLRDDRWELSSNNLEFDSARIVINNFRMGNKSEELVLDGVASRSRNDSLRLTLRNFSITPLTQVANSMGYYITGVSNGYATVKSLFKDSEIAADIDIDSMLINDYLPVPALNLRSRWDFELNRADLYITNRQKRDTLIRGFFRPSEVRYYARAKLDSLNLSALDPILNGVITDTRGLANANLIFRGEGRDATLEGLIGAKDLATTVDYTKVTYSVPEAQIVVQDSRFSTKDVVVKDPEGNSGLMNFNLDLSRLSNISYSVDVRPEKMLVLDTDVEDNDLFYGKVYASGDARIWGDKMGVRMNIAASTDDNTQFFMPLSGSTNVGKADFVTFVKESKIDTTDYLIRKKLMFERRNRKQKSSGGTMDINLALTVHPNARFMLVIDPQTGDQIEGTGEGMLNLHINPRQNIFEMTGDYEIVEGKYNFSLQNFIRKTFTIEPGSTISWMGEPMDALLNINAIYSTSASLSPLLGTTSGDNSNTRKVPVECVIHLGDNLADPSKEFSIRLPQADSETQTAVANILNNETTIARQVIYLLASGGFYPENLSSNSSNFGATASANLGLEFLANQVSNMLSGDSYNINIRYSTETELTGDEVDVGFSSNLVNDRLLIEVEGNYIIDNKQAVSNSSVSNFMGEASITYKIDPAGNLRLRGFTQTIDRYDETQGLQETGVGIYYKEDFNTFHDLKRQVVDRFTNDSRHQKRVERRAERKQKGQKSEADGQSKASPEDEDEWEFDQ